MAPVFKTLAQLLGAGFLVVLACALLSPAHAAGSKKTQPGAAARPAPGKPGKLTFAPAPSHESAAAREKRLQRECRGRPNAGACLGHTR